MNFSHKPLDDKRKTLFLDTNIISNITKAKLGKDNPREKEIYELLTVKIRERKVICIHAMQPDELLWDQDLYTSHMETMEELCGDCVMPRIEMLQQAHILTAMKGFIKQDPIVVLPGKESDYDPLLLGTGVEVFRPNTYENKTGLKQGLIELRKRGLEYGQQHIEEVQAIPRMVIQYGEEASRSELSSDDFLKKIAGVKYPQSLLASWYILWGKLGIKLTKSIKDFFESDYFIELPLLKIENYFMSRDISGDSNEKQFDGGPYDIKHAVAVMLYSDLAVIERSMKSRIQQSGLNKRNVKIFSLQNYQDFLNELRIL